MPFEEPIESHEFKETEHVLAHYPEHEPRSASALYNRTHHQLCILQDVPCFICGKSHKDSIITETHHFFCEWAAANAVNWVRFGKLAQNLYNPQTGKHIGSSFDWAEIALEPTLFIDSAENMVVLCADHHRAEGIGIHHVPFPLWILQAFPIDGYEFLTE
jgi:hypothetical protein